MNPLAKAAETEDQEENLLLGRYRLLQEAGKGGYGTVELAWDTRMQRRVAIKRIQIEGIDKETLEQLEQDESTWDNVPGLEEARTAALLNHPNIVTMYDFAIEGDTAYLFMEYIDGLTLSQVLKTAGNAMNLDMVAAVFSGVSQAIIFAHENQVLHLDIKPDNVLIDHKGQVKVTDFGLAALSSSQGYRAATGGTIGYMPPEQINLQPLDARCDEWALASLAYTMISGENPFLVRNLNKAAEAIENADIVLPSLCMEGLEEGADDVLFYALDPDRDERYDSVEDFAEEMQKFLGDEAAGRKQLAKLVQSSCSDEQEERPIRGASIMNHIGPLSKRGEAILTRIWAAAGTAALGYATITFIPGLGGWDNTVCLGVYLAIIALSVVLPHIGIAAGFIALGLALFVSEALIPGVLMVGLPAIWWWTTARRSTYLSCATITPAIAGLAGCSCVSPLLVGLFGKSKETTTCAVFTLFIAFIMAGFGSADLQTWQVGVGAYSGNVYSSVLLGMATSATFWITAASWILAAAATSLLCSKATRGWAVTGVIAGSLVLTAGAIGVVALNSSLAAFVPGFTTIVALCASMMIGLIACFVMYPAKRKSPKKA